MSNRKRAKEIGIEGIAEVLDNEWSKTYYHVQVGNFGVVVPDELNLDTLEGIKLIRGRASIITNKELAVRIASESEGNVLTVTELYSRKGIYL